MGPGNDPTIISEVDSQTTILICADGQDTGSDIPRPQRKYEPNAAPTGETLLGRVQVSLDRLLPHLRRIALRFCYALMHQ
jgi:hypothetical protein